METAVRVVILLAVLMHGLGHVMGPLAAWLGVDVGFSDAPWIFGGETRFDSGVGKFWGLLWLLALVGFVAAVIILLSGQTWWHCVLVPAAFLSLIAILPWWNTVVPGARYGAVLMDLAILVALLPAWGEQVRAFMQQ